MYIFCSLVVFIVCNSVVIVVLNVVLPFLFCGLISQNIHYVPSLCLVVGLLVFR